MRKLGHSPKPPSEGLTPFTIPLKLTPKGDTPRPAFVTLVQYTAQL